MYSENKKQPRFNKSIQYRTVQIQNMCTQADLDGFVGVSDESDEQAEQHVDEKRDEGVEVESAEKPHHVAFVFHPQKGAEHVVPIYEREETLCHFVKRSKLKEKGLIVLML